MNPNDFYMPPEWAPQEGTWLSWPYNLETFEDLLPQVEEIYVQFIQILTQGQKVFLVIPHSDYQPKLEQRFLAAKIPLEQIEFFPYHTQDVWFRDYGPIFVKSQENQEKSMAMVNWIFNAWGDKYDDLKEDSNIPLKMQASLGFQMFNPHIIMEGGSIDVNGEGILLTTEQCLLHPNRNAHLTRSEIEGFLREFLGITEIWWLKEGIVGDDTDGHIDDIARFVSQTQIIYCEEEDKTDENYSLLQVNKEILQNYVKNHPKIELISLPMPKPVIYNEIRLPASYANFYIANDHVIVPIFAQDRDAIALTIIQNCFPHRKVVGIDCRALVYGLGTLHCVSQQQPKKSE